MGIDVQPALVAVMPVRIRMIGLKICASTTTISVSIQLKVSVRDPRLSIVMSSRFPRALTFHRGIGIVGKYPIIKITFKMRSCGFFNGLVNVLGACCNHVAWDTSDLKHCCCVPPAFGYNPGNRPGLHHIPIPQSNE